MKVREEIEVHSLEADKPVLIWLLENYKWESQWRFVARCDHVRYGILSYQTNRVWFPSQEGRILYENRNQLARLAKKK